MVSTIGLKIAHASAESPVTISGSPIGRNVAVTTVSTSIKPTENATSPCAISASFGRNGAPAAAPRITRPVA